jgi:hypothetical protein
MVGGCGIAAGPSRSDKVYIRASADHMVAPGFLANPEVRRWLNGVEPAWTMLDFNSLNALRHEPSAGNHAIRLEPDLADAEISGSAVTANALLLLR